MPGDINSYALDLAFNISVAPAIDSLSAISAHLDQIDSQVKQLAGSISGQLSNAFGGISEQLSTMAETNGQIIQTFKDLQPEIQEVAKINESALDTYTKINEELTETRDLYKEIGKEIDVIDDSIEIVGDEIPDIAEASGEVKSSWVSANRSIGDNIKSLASMLVGIQAIKSAFADLVKEELLFEQIIYRSYGTMDDLVTITGNTSAQFGVLRSQASQAIKVLGQSMQVSQSQMPKYSAQMAAFNQLTGVSYEVTGDWMRNMRLAGYTLEDTGWALGKFTAMMESAGMTAKDIMSLMQEQASKTGTRYFTFGKEGSKVVNELQSAFVAMGKDLDGSAESFQRLSSSMADNIATTIFLERALGKIPDGYDKMSAAQQYQYAMMKGMPALLQQVQSQFGDMKNMTVQQRAAMESVLSQYASILGVSVEDISNVLQTMQEKGVNAEEAMAAAMKAAAPDKDFAKMMEDYNTSIGSLSKTWQQITSKAATAWMSIMIAAKPVLDWLLKKLEALTDWLVAATAPLRTLSSAANNVSNAANNVTNSINNATGATQQATMTWAKFGDGLSGIGVLLVAGGAIIGGFWLLGKAINWFLSQIDPVRMMVFAGSCLAIGGAVMMVASSLSQLAAIGNGLWPAVAALAAVFGVFALAVGGMILVGPIAIPVLLALGAGALMLAGAMWILSKAFQNVVGCITELLVVGSGPLIEVGTAFVLFGAGVLAGSMSLGAGAIALGIAAVAFGASMVALKAAMWFVNLEDINNLAVTMMSLGSAVELLSKYDISGMAAKAKDLAQFGKNVTSAASSISDASKQLTPAAVNISNALAKIDNITVDASKFDSLANGIKRLVVSLRDLPSDTSLDDFGSSLLKFSESIGRAGYNILSSAGVLAVASVPLAGAMRRIEAAVDSINPTTVNGAIAAIKDLDNTVNSVSLDSDKLVVFSNGVSSFGRSISDSSDMVAYGTDKLLSVMPRLEATVGGINDAVGDVDCESIINAAIALNILSASIDSLNSKSQYEQINGCAAAVDNLVDIVSDIGSSNEQINGCAAAISNLSNIIANTNIGAGGEQISNCADAIDDLANAIARLGSNYNPAVTAIKSGNDELKALIPAIDAIYNNLAIVIARGLDKIEAQYARVKNIMSPVQAIASSAGVPVDTVMATKPAANQTVMAETITTVKVTKEDGREIHADKRETALARQQVKILKELKGEMSKVGQGDGAKKIFELLEEWLPKLTQTPSRLSSIINDWQR